MSRRDAGRDLPTTQPHTVRRAHVEPLAVRVGEREGNIGFANQVGRKLAPDGIEIRRRHKPPRHRRQYRRQAQQDQQDANDSSTHGHAHRGMDSKPSEQDTRRTGREFLSPWRTTTNNLGPRCIFWIRPTEMMIMHLSGESLSSGLRLADSLKSKQSYRICRDWIGAVGFSLE